MQSKANLALLHNFDFHRGTFDEFKKIINKIVTPQLMMWTFTMFGARQNI